MGVHTVGPRMIDLWKVGDTNYQPSFDTFKMLIFEKYQPYKEHLDKLNVRTTVSFIFQNSNYSSYLQFTRPNILWSKILEPQPHFALRIQIRVEVALVSKRFD